LKEVTAIYREVHIKISDTKLHLIDKIDKLIKDYISEAKHMSNINGLYNLLFDEIEDFFTFKARNKDLLVNNNIHIQVI